MTHDPATIYRFFTEIGIINQLSSAKLESFLPGRMTSTQFGLLGHLSRRPEGETPLQLANAFQVAKTSMTHSLSMLNKRALIEISPNPNDARSKIARATSEGQAFLAQTMAELETALAPILQDIGFAPFTDSLPHLETVRMALDKARD